MSISHCRKPRRRQVLSRQGPYNIMPSPGGATECATGVIVAAVDKVDEDASGADAWLDDRGTELAELREELVMLVKVVEDKCGVDIAVLEILEVASGIVGAEVDCVTFPMDAVEILGEFEDKAKDILLAAISGIGVVSKGFTKIKSIH